VVQIETKESVERAEEIAAVAGVDVLFVGPLDLSVNMNMAQNFKHPEFEQAMDRVVAACRRHGKAAGILLPTLDYLSSWTAKGFTFLVVGSDGGCVAGGLKSIAAAGSQYKLV
jgi:2-keto-3-deoxy-L-rhamnonate aldolase RhmA